MWYNYLRRDQPYLRSYRTHNLWLDQYHVKIRTQRHTPFHINFFKRMAKTYSGNRVMANLWGLTFIGIVKFMLSFKEKSDEDKTQAEMYNRLQTIYSKNKFGFQTRIMSDFDLLLEAALNERFIDESTGYYDDPIFQKEIEDVEAGLAGDMSEADIKHAMRDPDAGHHGGAKCSRLPGRWPTNYEKTDALSIYKVLPKGQRET
mgnify:CR=1 FL=1